jgi:choline dehydrogenase
MYLSFIIRILAGAAFAALFGIGLWPESHHGSFRWLPTWNAIFDYVVVGGGTAGITIGTRLAQNGFKVAIVEAGGYYERTNPISKVPGAAVLGVGADINTASAADWRFVAYKVPGAAFRDIHYARGKCMGGSCVSNYPKIIYRGLTGCFRSALNFMIYQR